MRLSDYERLTSQYALLSNSAGNTKYALGGLHNGELQAPGYHRPYWIATYSDGTSDDGRKIPYSQINRDKLVHFALFDDDEKPDPLFDIAVLQSHPFAWRRRGWMNTAGQDREINIVVANGGVYIVHEGGKIEHFDDFVPGHEYADPIVPMECEEK